MTTNYENSKKLQKANFKFEAEFYWVKWNEESEPELVHESQLTPHLIESVPSWDFETILTALPKKLFLDFGGNKKRNFELRVWFESKEIFIGYQNFEGFFQDFTYRKQEHENLADFAGKLWLELKKAVPL